MAGALDDLRVLEIAEGWAGPLCGKLLAELGAEVLKIEPPRGDYLRRLGPFTNGYSYAFELANAGKRSIGLDLAQEGDRKRLATLIAEADVVIQGRYPGPTLGDLGLGYESLRGSNTGLIWCSITPFGLTGPLAGWAGSELTVQAASGVMAATGYPGGPPLQVRLTVAEGTGALSAAIAILAALCYRDRTGIGQFIDMALYDTMTAFLGQFGAVYLGQKRVPPRDGNRHPVSYPWNSYRAKDGYVIICTGASATQWPTLLKIMGREDLLNDPRYDTIGKRRRRADEVDEIVEAWTGSLTVEEIVKIMESHRIPTGPIATLDQVLTNPHAAHRKLVMELGHPVLGKVKTSGPLCHMSETPGRILYPAPALGADGDHGFPRRPRMPVEADPPKDALAGLRVIEISIATTGPWAGRTLASLGAEVIKVEPPGGERTRMVPNRVDGLCHPFSFINNTDKKSITLDTSIEAGRNILKRLVATADIFLENFAAGTLAKAGLGYQELKTINPNLIYASLTGFGSSGPYSFKRAYDTVVQAMAGVLSLTGEADSYPIKAGISLSDVAGGTLGPVAILAALHFRNRAGLGQHIDVSMYEATAWLTQDSWPIYFAIGQPPRRSGNRHPLIVPHNTYRASDGLMALSVETEEEWSGLCEAMGRHALAADAGLRTCEGRANRARELDETVARWISDMTTQEAVALCQGHGVPAAPVLELDQALDHPHAAAREDVLLIADPSGTVRARALGSPIKLSLTPSRVRQAMGPPGLDNEEIYTQLGLTSEEVQKLRAEGII